MRQAHRIALTLVLVSVGPLAHPHPSTVGGPPDGPRLVLQHGPPGAAVPTSSSASAWVDVTESGDEPPPSFDRRADRAHGVAAATHAGLRGPTTPELLARRAGGALLGLSAAPANAPPLA